jgi:hypothetical protein
MDILHGREKTDPFGIDARNRFVFPGETDAFGTCHHSGQTMF